MIAYNNLGINLMLIGDWTKAEEMITKALDIAEKEGSVARRGHLLDSLGELKMLRGETEEAQEMLERAINLARENKRGWYEIQSMRNLARCYLAKGEPERAIEIANETIALSAKLGDKHFASMAGLVLAEANLDLGKPEDCEEALTAIEQADKTDDFFVLGNIQRIRGLVALADDDTELAIHHFQPRTDHLRDSWRSLSHRGAPSSAWSNIDKSRQRPCSPTSRSCR